jgi:hypothetical protein
LLENVEIVVSAMRRVQPGLAAGWLAVQLQHN